jgi:PAS domain-containing protein
MRTRTPIWGCSPRPVGGRFASTTTRSPRPTAWSRVSGSSSPATAHRELHASEARYQSVVAAMAEGVMLLDADGRVTACNASAERIRGLDRERIVGSRLGEERWAAVREDGTPAPSDELPALDTLRTGRAHHDVVRGNPGR